MTAVSLYIDRPGRLHQLHPFTKAALLFFCLVVGFAIPTDWGAYAVALGLLFPLAAAAGVAGPLFGRTWRIVLPFAISLLLVQGLFWPQGTPLLALGPLAFKVEGVTFAIRMTGRILLIVAAFLLLTLITRPDALMLALTSRGFSPRLAYILLTTLQIIPRFQNKASTILDAQRSRGLETEGGLRRRIAGLLPLVQPLILGSIVDIEERAIALEARAFGKPGPRTHLMSLADSRAQQIGRWVLLVAALAAVVARLAL